MKKSVWVPILLAIYLIAMALWFGPRLIREGETLRLILVVIVEAIIIILVRLFLLRKERNQK